MPGQPPPSRYRIYERNRRLVVIDSWAQGAAAGDIAASAPSMARQPQRHNVPGKLDRIAFDGRTSFNTHPLFDAKGPRTIILDPGSASAISAIKIALVIAAAVIAIVAVIFPYLLFVLLVLLQRRVRNQLRTSSTAWLDRAAGAIP
jgi:hypothetical protein